MTGEDTTGTLVLAELSAIRAQLGDVRERLVVIEASTASLRGLEERVRALEIAGAGVSTRLAVVGSGGGLVVGAAVAYLSKVVFGG